MLATFQPIRLATTVGALRAHIVKHTSGPLNARGSDVAMEQLTLVYERLEME
jgi:hypothetical protein